MSQGKTQKPTSINKTLLQQAKITGFYDQYDKNLDLAAEWVTSANSVGTDNEISEETLGLIFNQMAFIGSEPMAPVIYLRDLDYTPLAYLVADGILVYILPCTYNVPSMHSKAKILPDLEIQSVMHQLVKSIENDNYSHLFEAYHKCMLYGEFNMQDKCYSDYTRVEWMKLTELLKQSPAIVTKLNQTLNAVRQDCYSIESIAKNISWLLEKELKECLKKINLEASL